MYCGFHEEDDKCPECKGTLYYPEVENCSCHINPPCSACTSRKLTCKECGWEEDEPEYKDVPTEYAGLSVREYKPRPLDPSKIDFRLRPHSNSSMIKEGVYPEGTTADDIRKVVNGPFGGKFEYIRDGKFKFIAYTD